MAFPQNVLDQIQDRCDIVEIIASYIPLKKAGRNYKALCPFHHEKTPSFMVSPDKQIYHCFGCGVGGNVFNFIMQHEKLEFGEVVRMLAQKTGVVLPELRRESEKDISLANQLYKINEIAANFYHDYLVRIDAKKEGYKYLTSRGIEDAAIKNFKLGFAPPLWDGLLNFARNKGINAGILERAGLAIPGQKEGYYDRFRNRIIFPIFDIKNKIIAFGGRVLDDSLPKYMNSPDTFIYNKGRHLYGFHLSKDYVRRQDAIAIVEGYLDLITPYEAGVRNLVATLGTALTSDQIRLIKRYTNNAVMIYDADAAGQMATLRNLDLLIQEGLHVEIAALPEGYDPDSFVRKYGGEKFGELIKDSKDLFDYKLSLLFQAHDPATIKGKAKIAEEMLPTILLVPNAVIVSGYIKRLAEALEVQEESLRTELKKVKPDYSYRWEEGKSREKSKARLAERMLAHFMLEDINIITQVKETLRLDDFKDPTLRRIVEELFRLDVKDESVAPARLMMRFEGEEVTKFISELVMESYEASEKSRMLSDCIKWIRQENLKEHLKLLQSEIKLAQDTRNEDKISRLVNEYNKLIRSTR